MWLTYVERGRCAKLSESVSAPHPVIVALSLQACLRACMRTSTCACVSTCMHTYAQACMCACTCICACARVRVHAHAYACASMYTRMRGWRILVAAPRRVRRCLGRVRTYVRVHACARVYAWARMCTPAVSVTCTLEQVFWALVHGRVCTLHRCVFTPTYISVNTLTAGCAHVCVCIYVCIWMRVCMDACMRL